MAAVGLSSVVCAFVFTSRMTSNKENSNLELVEAKSVATEDVSESSLNETTKKQEQENKDEVPDKAESNTTTNNDLSDIVNDEETDKTQDSATDIESDKILVPLESIVANLGGVESRRYLRVLVNLEVSNEEAQTLVNAKMVIIRDKLISFFSGKSTNDLESEGSLFNLRVEVKNSLNKLLGSNKIKQVYFSDFIVQ